MSDSDKEFNDNVTGEETEASFESTSSSKNQTSAQTEFIRKIIETHFDDEIAYKHQELNAIDERIRSAKDTLDKLRVCIICKFYSQNGHSSLEEYKNHPAIRHLQHEHIEAALNHYKHVVKGEELRPHSSVRTDTPISELNSEQFNSIQFLQNKQFQMKISVGNVSKYLKSERSENKSPEVVDEGEASQYNQDLITHKWMIYIRSANCKRLDSYIKKVIFYLHSSYKPYDIVEVKSAPFQLIKRGWGEFPIHVQIHFKDPRNKRLDISHLLKLDWTQTGLQTFGGETTQESLLLIKPNDYIATTTNTAKTNPHDAGESVEKQDANQQILTYEQPQGLAEKVEEIEQAPEKETWSETNFTPQFQYEMDHSKRSESSCSGSFINSPTVQASYFNDQPRQLVPVRFDLSPSHFISTNLLNNSEMSINEKKNGEQTASFDDLMQNFCSLNDLDNEGIRKVGPNKQNSSREQDPRSDEVQNDSGVYMQQETCSIDSNVLMKSSSKVKTIPAKEQDSKAASLDALLNLRPKSILSSTPINQQPIQQAQTKQLTPSSHKSPLGHFSAFTKLSPVIKTTVKSGFISSNHSSIATKVLAKAINTQTPNSIVLMPNKPNSNIIKPQISNMVSNSFPKPLFNNMKLVKPIQVEKNFTTPEIGPSNKRMVIYKVEPSDTLRNNEVTTDSFKPISKLGLTLENSSTLSKTQMYDSEALKQNQLLKQAANGQTIVETSAQKKFSTQITKVKSSSGEKFANDSNCLGKRKVSETDQKQELLDNNCGKKFREQAAILKNCSSAVKDTCLDSVLSESINQSTLNLPISNQATCTYSVEYLIEQLISNHKQPEKVDFESCLKIALKHYPIVLSRYCPNVKQKMPYCARSIHEFYSWPYGKRRANEWMRALHIKKKCLQMIKASHRLNNSISNEETLKETIWSTKSVVLWLRSHGYTPLEHQHMMPSNILQSQPQSIQKDLQYVNSFTPINRFLPLKNQDLSDSLAVSCQYDTDTEQDSLIDVVGGPIEKASSKTAKYDIKIEHNYDSEISGDQNYLEMCEGTRYVREQLDQLNIRTGRVQLAPSVDSSDTYSCDLVEKFLFVLCKRFAEDLIRQTCADLYFDQSKNMLQEKVLPQEGITGSKRKNESSLKRQVSNTNLPGTISNSDADNQLEIIQYQVFPGQLGVLDVFNTINKQPAYDFLTNKHMANAEQTLDASEEHRVDNISGSNGCSVKMPGNSASSKSMNNLNSNKKLSYENSIIK